MTGGIETPQLETCPRCDSKVDAYDLETDPRWGKVCDECNEELLRRNGEFSQ